MQELGNELLKIALSILMLTAPLIVAVFARLLRHYLLQLNEALKLELKANQYDLLMQVTAAFVAAAEQLYDDNDLKFAAAAKSLMAFAAKNDIELTPSQAQMIVESTVYAFKQGISDDGA